MNDGEKCYLCGSIENLTRDHIPPKCLFPKPRPNNLYTLPCCYACNNGASKDDEYLRLATSLSINRSEKGDLAFERVKTSTLKSNRIGELLEELRSSMKQPVQVETPVGKIEAAQLNPQPINRCLVQITKGILAANHPEIDLRALDFEITRIDQFKLESIVQSGIAERFIRWSIGDGVYDSWRAVAREDLANGATVHSFYESAVWMVFWHSPGDGQITVHGADDWSHDAPGGLRTFDR